MNKFECVFRGEFKTKIMIKTFITISFKKEKSKHKQIGNNLMIEKLQCGQ